MAVAVVAAYVVHSFAVSPIGPLDVVVELGVLACIQIKHHVLVRLAERKFILAHVVRTREVVDDSIRTTNASVPDKREEPGDHG